MLNKPVFVFPDPDPADLVIALTTPGYTGLCLPPPEEIDALLHRGRSVTDRHFDQMPGAENTLNSATDPEVSAHWKVLKKHGKALPQ